jgi:hypothetical protein
VREGETLSSTRSARESNGIPGARVVRPRRRRWAGDFDARPSRVVIDVDDDDARRRQLERLGLRVTPKEFPFFHWRALFTTDPERNTVEFVCYGPNV